MYLKSLMDLEVYLQLAIPLGFIGYLIARSGINHKDRNTTIVYVSLCFSLISVLVWKTVGLVSNNIFWLVLSTISLTIVSAWLWKKYLCYWALNLLYKSKASNFSGYPDTWTEIIENTKVGVSQLSVKLKNGQTLICNYIYDFSDAPLSKLRWDHKGNIAMYVTDIKMTPTSKSEHVNQSPKETTENVDHYRLTYIPVESIESVEIVTNHPVK